MDARPVMTILAAAIGLALLLLIGGNALMDLVESHQRRDRSRT